MGVGVARLVVVAAVCLLAIAPRPAAATPLASLHHHRHHHDHQHQQQRLEEEEFRFQDMPGTIQSAILAYCCDDKKDNEERAACHLQVSVATSSTFQWTHALTLGLFSGDKGETGELLGSGAFGRVDSVQCNRPDRPDLALKKVCDKKCHSNRSHREFEIQKRATEQCCVEGQPCPRVLAFTTASNFLPCCMGTHGHHWLLMPRMDGKNLLLSPRPAGLPNMLAQLTTQLKCLHRHGIVHNDVKAANIVVSRDGMQFGLLDFGLSCMDNAKCLANAAGSPHMVKVNPTTKRASTNTPGGDFFALAHTHYIVDNFTPAIVSQLVSCDADARAIRTVCQALAFDHAAFNLCLDCNMAGGARAW